MAFASHVASRSASGAVRDSTVAGVSVFCRCPVERFDTQRALLVEDDPARQRMVGWELTRQGVAPGSLALAHDGIEAMDYLNLALEHLALPQLVILNVSAQRSDGRNLLCLIRNHTEDAVRALPVVIVSTNPHRDRQITGGLGVMAYISRLHEFGEFLAVLGAWLVQQPAEIGYTPRMAE